MHGFITILKGLYKMNLNVLRNRDIMLNVYSTG